MVPETASKLERVGSGKPARRATVVGEVHDDRLGINRVVCRVRMWSAKGRLPPRAQRIVDTDVLMGVALSHLASHCARTGRQPTALAIDAAALAEFGLILRLARLELLDGDLPVPKQALLQLLEAEARATNDVLGGRGGRDVPEIEALVASWDSRSACEAALALLCCNDHDRDELLRKYCIDSFVEASRLAAGDQLPIEQAERFGHVVGEVLAAQLLPGGDRRRPELATLEQLDRYAPVAPVLRAKLLELEHAAASGAFEVIHSLACAQPVPGLIPIPQSALESSAHQDPALLEVVELLRDDLQLSGSALAEDIARTYATPKGKLMRATLTLSFARMSGSAAKDAVPFAAAIEGLHQASLVVDDLIDQATVRHGVPTIAQRYGGKVALAICQYLMSRAAARLYPVHRRGWRVLQRALFVMLEGQQREEKAGVIPTRRAYLQTVQDKTAYLLATACAIGVVAAGGSRAQERAAHDTGLRLGMAFQIIDDYLDYFGTPSFGKRIGGDFEAGVVTLPILLLLARKPEQHHEIQARLIRRHPGDLEWLIELMRAERVDVETLDNARYYAQRAQASLMAFAPSDARACVEQMTTWVIERER